jgi:hypothetical protein
MTYKRRFQAVEERRARFSSSITQEALFTTDSGACSSPHT